ncbi:MAG: AAA family ATPase [Planctomycetota bacterium]
MRITDLHVDGFGVWNDLRLRKLSPEITVFYGDNEAGKTTLLEFLRSMMYGVSPERRERYLPPADGGRQGGRMGLVDDGQPFEATRYADRGDDDRGLVRINLPGGETQGDRLLRDALEGIDELTFNNVFAVGLDEIQQLGTLGGAEAAKCIYRLTSGLDRVSLYDVILGLRDSRRRLLDEAGAPSIMAELVARRDALATDISDLTAQNRRWSTIAVELDELGARVESARAELKQAERAARRVEVAIGLKGMWAERLKIDDRLAGYAGLFPLPPTAIDDLDELGGKIEEHRRQRDILKGQRKQLHQEADELGVNDVLVRNGCRLDALAEQQEWIQSLEQDTQELEEEADKIESRIQGENRRLGKLWSHDPQHTPELTEEMALELEPVAEQMQDAERDAARARKQLDAKRDSELQYRTKIESAMAAGDKMGLPTDIKQAGDLVAMLRRRLQVEQRTEQSRRHAQELEQQSHDLLDKQAMPMELFVFLCGAAVLSAVLFGLFLWGRFYPNSIYGQWGPWAAALGLGGPILMGFIKYFAEESAADQLDATQRQLEIVERQVAEGQRDQRKLDTELPMIEGSVVLMLQKAERHLADLEKVLPVETQRRQAGGEVASAEAAHTAAQEHLAEARGKWTAGLRALGLPEKITPADLTTMWAQYEQLSQLRVKAENRRDEVERRQRELAKVTQRIESLAEEADLVLEDEDATPIDQLDVLLTERRLQQTRIDHRKKLQQRAADIKEKELRRHKASLSLVERREALFRTAGVADEQGYRRLAASLADAAELRGKRDQLTKEIAAAIGRLGTEEDFAPMLSADAVGRLDGQWETLSAEHERIDLELRELLGRRGSLEEQRKALAEDTSLADKRMELDAVEAQLAEAAERWREHAAVGQMLELIRSDYEANRQPDTLLEASKHLERLTGGRYPRVWTPLANDILLVDNRHGQSLPVDSLSRGTREQLFLSVRMAIVAMFARRGIQLPMILDDILVNFDAGRSRTAASVLCDFAKQGHQLLVFTCHEHVWEMFKDLHADVRRLPNRFGDGELPVVEQHVVEEAVVEEAVVEEVVVEPEPEPAAVAVAPLPEPQSTPVEPSPVEPARVEADYAELPPRTIAEEYLEAEYVELEPAAFEPPASELARVEAGYEVAEEALVEAGLEGTQHEGAEVYVDHRGDSAEAIDYVYEADPAWRPEAEPVVYTHR